VGAVQLRSAEGAVGRQRGLRPRQRDLVVVVLLHRRQTGTGLAAAHLVRIRFSALLCGDCHNLAGAVLVGRVIEKSANVVYEERVQQLRNLLLVGEIEGAVKRNPAKC
jgi:hypothetical protein